MDYSFYVVDLYTPVMDVFETISISDDEELWHCKHEWFSRIVKAFSCFCHRVEKKKKKRKLSSIGINFFLFFFYNAFLMSRNYNQHNQQWKRPIGRQSFSIRRRVYLFTIFVRSSSRIIYTQFFTLLSHFLLSFYYTRIVTDLIFDLTSRTL